MQDFFDTYKGFIKLALILGIVAAFLLGAARALAASVLIREQTVSTATATGSGGNQSLWAWFGYVTGTASRVTYYASGTSGAAQNRLLYICSTNNAETCRSTPDAQISPDEGTVVYTGAKTLYTVTFSANTYAGKYILLFLGTGTGGSNTVITYGNATDNVTGDCFLYNSLSTVFSACSGVADVYFQLYANERLNYYETALATPTGTFDVPWGSAAITEMAQEWRPPQDWFICEADAGFQVTAGESPLDRTYGSIWKGGATPKEGSRIASIGVNGIVLPDAPTSTLQTLAYGTPYGGGCIEFKKDIPHYFVIHRDALTPQEEYAMRATTSTQANSRGWVGRLGSWETTSTNWVVGLFGSTTSTDYTDLAPPAAPFTFGGEIETCPNYGVIGTAICDVFVWLFVPDDQAIAEEWTELTSTTQSKIPWGYWSQVSAGFAAVSSTQPVTSTAFVLQVPAYADKPTSSVNVLNIALIQSRIPANLLTLIQVLGGIAIWAIFGTWIWSLVTGNKPAEDEDV